MSVSLLENLNISLESGNIKKFELSDDIPYFWDADLSLSLLFILTTLNVWSWILIKSIVCLIISCRLNLCIGRLPIK